MTNRFALAVTLLTISLMLAGCYTQLSYFEPLPQERQTRYRRHIQEEATKIKPGEKARGESEGETDEVKPDEPSESDEGYYGRHKPTYRRYAPGYAPYEYYDYPPYPYPYPYTYGGYYSFYPSYRYYGGYRYSYGHYGHHYGHSYRRHHSTSKVLSRQTYKNSSRNYGNQRSQSYRGRAR